MTDETFMELQALGHSLPGPTSTQMVVAVAASRGGLLGALVAFCLWSLPAFIVLVSAAAGANVLKAEMSEIWWLQGLPPAAVALIFSAAYKMGNKSCNDNITRFLGLMSSCIIVLLSSSDVPLHVFDFMYPGLLVAGGLTTLVWYTYFPKDAPAKKTSGLDVHLSAAFGGFLVLVWAGLFAFFSYSRFVLGSDDKFLTLTETFYRIGSVIFGGGQVVLPMLLTQVVGPGWVTEEQFYSGMALTQACPGPLFNFSAYLGAVRAGIPGALSACFGLFFPGCILILAVSPFWLKIRDQVKSRIKATPTTHHQPSLIHPSALHQAYDGRCQRSGGRLRLRRCRYALRSDCQERYDPAPWPDHRKFTAVRPHTTAATTATNRRNLILCATGADAIVVIVVAASAGSFNFPAPFAIGLGGAVGAVLALCQVGLSAM